MRPNVNDQDTGQHFGEYCQVTAPSGNHAIVSRRRTIASVVLGSVVVISSVLWIRRSDVWPMPMSVLNSSIAVDGEEREYRLVVPDTVRHGRLIPVVFALHGAMDTTSEMAEYTDLDRLAVQEGFLLVYLQGRNLSWPPFIPPENPNVMVPDIKLFETLCDEMVRQHHADPRRVYVVGVSQGGAMANVLTVKCSKRIAATVCCCGWLPQPLGQKPLNTQYKCPMLFIVGSQDRQVSPATVRAASDAFVREGHPVEYRMIRGFGHGWPRSQDENQRIWEFLNSHHLPDPLSDQGKQSTMTGRGFADSMRAVHVEGVGARPLLPAGW